MILHPPHLLRISLVKHDFHVTSKVYFATLFSFITDYDINDRQSDIDTFKSVWFLANVNSSSCSLYVIVGPSVVCLSSVTFVRPTQTIEIFCNVSTP